MLQRCAILHCFSSFLFTQSRCFSIEVKNATSKQSIWDAELKILRRKRNKVVLDEYLTVNHTLAKNMIPKAFALSIEKDKKLSNFIETAKTRDPMEKLKPRLKNLKKKNSLRTLRLSSEIKNKLLFIFQEHKDKIPYADDFLSCLKIEEIVLDKNIQQCIIHWSCDEKEQEKDLKVKLEKANKALRHFLSQTIAFKFVPQITFKCATHPLN